MYNVLFLLGFILSFNFFFLVFPTSIACRLYGAIWGVFLLGLGFSQPLQPTGIR